MLTTCGVFAFGQSVWQDNGLHPLALIALSLFTVLFGWIAFSFSLAMVGFLQRQPDNVDSTDLKVRHEDAASRVGHAGPLTQNMTGSRTAVLMAVYNESPLQVTAAIGAIQQQLRELAPANEPADMDRPSDSDRFDFYILSDTTNPEIQREEKLLFDRLKKDAPSVYYRHRKQNTSRKAGNVADFCENWGDHYRYMIVLDADSLMTASTLVEMVHRMDADEQVGIIQVPPVPIGRLSLFARLQQFSAAAYGPAFAQGLAAFAGEQSNYWGHNAILRVSAFKACCSLPTLTGLGSIGGEILSHDFVEAGLMVRSGWKVCLANDLRGSFEECPTTIRDYAIRDHRWCQGNLQHWKLALAEGFHPVSRFHFVSGILSYLMSPIWLAFVFVTTLGLFAAGGQGSQQPNNSVMMWLFVISMSMLAAPKIVALVQLLVRENCQQFGGRGRLIASCFLETVLSILFAPINAIHHSRFVIAVMLGKQVGWDSQARDERGISLKEAVADCLGMTLTGVAATGLIFWIAPAILPWFAPLVAAWTLSIPIAMLMASTSVGTKLKRAGLLQIAQETRPEAICELRNAWVARLVPQAG